MSKVKRRLDPKFFTDSDPLTNGQAGLYDLGDEEDREFSELVVRSAPRLSVHQWNFTTSRYEGFVEHLDSFEEVVHREEVNGIDTQRLTDAIEEAESGMTSHRQLYDSAKEDLEQASESEVTDRRQ